jgi:hypothetical protein
MKKTFMFCFYIFILCGILFSRNKENIFPGADESTPSKSEYFSWINNTNEGPSESQTLINLDFFKWLRYEYGMKLDIYAFDAGTIDGKRFYGSMHSDRFKRQFPNGFDPVFNKAKDIDIRLGIWCGPDGFGNTPEEEKDRIDQMVKLCRDYHFALFKFDKVCGKLRPEKEDAFIKMMIACRKYSPDLIALNHRLGLKKGRPYTTTSLMKGKETYIDVFTINEITASHHRAGALSRELPLSLMRLTEDHGVCLSSCLDYWDDDLILQAFNRSLILSPQIYGNTWLLNDNEFPKLARIFNLHRKYRSILVQGIILPETYGPNAVSRGNDRIRIITLRNITWKDTSYTVTLNEEIGLTSQGKVEVRQFHPFEKITGLFDYGDRIEVSVTSFRSCLIYIGTEFCDEPGVTGTEYQVIKNIDNQPVEIEILGMPGTRTEIILNQFTNYSSAILENQPVDKLLKGKPVKIKFPGMPLKNAFHRKLADFNVIDIPEYASILYDATVFSADNNALEVRSIKRSGWSQIPAVRKAQEAFFNQDMFVNRGIWDKNLFDNNDKTGFWPSRRQSRKYKQGQIIKGGCFRLDLGEVVAIDRIELHIPDIYSIHPLFREEGNIALVSSDLVTWDPLIFYTDTLSIIPVNRKIRYLKMDNFPQRMVEIKAFKNEKQLNREKWRANNLFASTSRMNSEKVWKTIIILNEIPVNSYLCIAVNGAHGFESVYAAAKMGNTYLGCPDRAPSYNTNAWETVNAKRDKNYTYYLPLSRDMTGQEIEVYVIAYEKDKLDLDPELYISAYPVPYMKQRLVLRKRQ